MVSLVLPLTEYDEVCAISQERFQDLAARNELVATACGHKFEVLSLNTWLAERNSCPVCRGEVYEGDLLPVALAVAEVRGRVERAAAASRTLNGDLTDEEAISIAKETSKSEMATKALFKKVQGAFTEDEAIAIALKESAVQQ